MNMSRRHLLGFAIALGLPQGVVSHALAASAVNVRENITVFAQDPAKVKALRAAVDKMQKRSKAQADDPLGWYYWSAVHGTDEQVPAALSKIYDMCDHTRFDQFGRITYLAEHFISWHRAFLFFFEAVLKAAAVEAGETTDFNLPYWNWYADGKIPAIFTDGTAASNPLWHSRKNTALNPQALDQTFFTEPALLPANMTQWDKSFSVPMEVNPHGTVHSLIGKDMGNILTSARDPIFWLHHANIDRLWTKWTKDGHSNPTGTWQAKSWAFDKANTKVAKVSDLIDSEAVLKYRYDNLDIVPPAPAAVVAANVAPPPPVQVTATPQSEAPAAMAPLAAAKAIKGLTASKASALSLGNAPVQVNMALSPAHGNKLRAFALNPAGGDITGAWLVIDDIKVGKDGGDGGYSYAVNVSLTSAPEKRVRLTELNSFMMSVAQHGHGAGAHTAEKFSLSFPLKDILARLGIAATTDLSSALRVTIDPAQIPTEQNPQYLNIGSISIQTTTQPIQ